MKNLSLLISFFLFISCSNSLKLKRFSAEKQEILIKENFNELSKNFYTLLEDEIEEKKRKTLEEKFIILKNEINSINTTASSKHAIFLNSYSNLINLKIQYLKDLK